MKLAVPGERALVAANPCMLDTDGCPNLVREMIPGLDVLVGKSEASGRQPEIRLRIDF